MSKPQVTECFLTPNEWSRPRTKLEEVKAIVMHWTANPAANEVQNRDYFEARKAGCSSYGSAHYIIGQTGRIIQCIPESELAYHCGTNRVDPISKRVYTDEARRRFGAYATERSSPNHCTLGIELCPIDEDGNFTNATLTAAAELVADICRRYKLNAEAITTHHNIVGWKKCPLLWTEKPELLEVFRSSVEWEMQKEEI